MNHQTDIIPTYLGAPLLPPVERVRYERPARFARLWSWIDTSPVVDGLFYGACAVTVAATAALAYVL